MLNIGFETKKKLYIFPTDTPGKRLFLTKAKALSLSTVSELRRATIYLILHNKPNVYST